MLLAEIKNIKSTTKEVRKFGITIGIFLFVIAGFLFWKDRATYPYFIYAGVAFAATGLILPIVLKPIYRAWMTFAVIMGFIMTRVILTILFFGIFTPASVISKLLRKDLLNKKIDNDSQSYWVKRPSAAYNPQSSEKMF